MVFRYFCLKFDGFIGWWLKWGVFFKSCNLQRSFYWCRPMHWMEIWTWIWLVYLSITETKKVNIISFNIEIIIGYNISIVLSSISWIFNYSLVWNSMRFFQLEYTNRLLIFRIDFLHQKYEMKSHLISLRKTILS